MHSRYLRLAVAVLLALPLSSCAYYHAWNGISYMMDENKALTQEASRYQQGQWQRNPASAAESAQVEAQIRRGYLTDLANFITEFGVSDLVHDAIVSSRDKVNIRFGKTFRYSQGKNHYFCSSFLVLDENGENHAKNTVTPIFVESFREPNLANTSETLVKKLCH